MPRLWIGGADAKRDPSAGPTSAFVLDQRENVVALEAVAAVQELKLDHEGEPDDLPAELLDEVDLRLRRPPCREQIVVDEHALPGRDCVGVELERVEAVLERVLHAD